MTASNGINELLVYFCLGIGSICMIAHVGSKPKT
jgi:hypothetical protein